MSEPFLASIDDLATKTRRSATDAGLVLALRRATDRFIAECGHRDGDGNYVLFRVVDDVVYVSGTGGDTLLLPSAPVVGQPAVAIDGQGIDAPAFQVGRRTGLLRAVGGYWPDGLENIAVTYTHGFLPEKVPGDIADAVLEHAETLFRTAAHVQQEGALSQSVGNFAAAMVGTTQKWADAVERHGLNRGDRA